MKISLKKRIEQKKLPEALSICSEPVSSIFLGASLLAGTEYLSWEAEKIFNQYAAKNMKPIQFRYGLLVHHAAEGITTISETLREEGEELLYELAIEPFYLMERKNQNKGR